MTAFLGRPRRSHTATAVLPTPRSPLAARGAGRDLAVAALLALITLLVAVAVAAALPAAAHDQIVSSDPADDAVLPTSPAAITLTFSEAPLDVEPQIVVSDSTGTIVFFGTPTIDGTSAVLPVPAPLADGAYQAAWRVVSSDGHPIEGALTFTVGTPPTEPPREADDTPLPVDPTPSGSLASTAEPTDGADRLPLFIGLGAAGVAAVGAALVLVRRNRSKETHDDAS